MRPRLSRVIDIPLSPAATRRARQLTALYSTALILHAKTLAAAQRDDTVRAEHIDYADRILQEQRQYHRRRRTWGAIIGGACFGASFPGIAIELARGPMPHVGLLAFFFI